MISAAASEQVCCMCTSKVLLSMHTQGLLDPHRIFLPSLEGCEVFLITQGILLGLSLSPHTELPWESMALTKVSTFVV